MVKLPQVRAAHRDLRDLCSLMGGQMGRFRSLLEYAGKSAGDLRDRVSEVCKACKLHRVGAAGM